MSLAKIETVKLTMFVPIMKTVSIMHKKNKYKVKFYAISDKYQTNNYLYTYKVDNYNAALRILRKHKGVKVAYFEINGQSNKIDPSQY